MQLYKRKGTQIMPDIDKTLKILAKRKGISVTELRTEMQSAIKAAYININFNAKCVSSENEIPTVEEFLEYAVNRVEMRVNTNHH